MRISGDFAPIWEDDRAGGSNSARQASKRLRRQSLVDLDDDGDTVLYPEVSTLRRRNGQDNVDNTDPFYVAGHDPDDPLPSSAFPHAPAHVVQAEHDSRSKLPDELASLNPPLYAQSRTWTADAGAVPLPRQHASVMNSILHVSLLRGDYIRAGHAFGLLLRASSGNSAIALRSNGNWGIGAEILLRQGSAINNPSRHHFDDPDDDNDFHDHIDESSPTTMPESLAAAKDYYESLIVQYPYLPKSPHAATAIDARTFYPALFGLLIHEATESSRLAQQRLTSPSPDADADSLAVADIKRAELRAARTIASRIDDLVASPQYDRFHPLLRLRGMVALWVADLVLAVAGERDLSDESDDEARTEGLRLVEMERDKARMYFERCVQAGGHVPEELMRR